MEKGYTKKRYRRKIPKVVRWYDKHRNEDKTFDKSDEEEKDMAKSKIEQEIDSMAKSLEESQTDPRDLVIQTIETLGPEGLKKAMPDLTNEQKETLESVLLDMKKSVSLEKGGPGSGKKGSGKSDLNAQLDSDDWDDVLNAVEKIKGAKAAEQLSQMIDNGDIPKVNKLVQSLKTTKKSLEFDTVTPKKEMTKLDESGAELENGSDDEDEKVAQAADSGFKNQGGSSDDGAWEGQVIKSDDFEKGRGPDKKPRKKRGSGAAQPESSAKPKAKAKITEAVKDTVFDAVQDADNAGEMPTKEEFEALAAKTKMDVPSVKKLFKQINKEFKGHQSDSLHDDMSKSKSEDINMAKSIDEIIDETLEKSYGMKKMMDKKDVKDVAEKEAKDEVKDHKDKMHKMKKSLVALKDEIIKSYEDAGLSWNNDLIKSEMKKKLNKEEDQVEMGGQDKGGKADRADKNAPDDVKVYKDQCTTADDAKCNPAKMKKSVKFDKDETTLLKANTLGRNHHFSINNYYDEAIRKSATGEEQPEPLKKSESEYDINDLIEKGMDTDADDYMTNHMLEEQKLGGEFKKSFSNEDLEKACQMSKKEAAKVMGEDLEKTDGEKKPIKKTKTVSMGVRG